MTRETPLAKAKRYLAHGRLTVIRVDGDLADAIVQGDTGQHHVSHDPRGWHCNCPAYGRCAHIVALQLVTIWTPSAPPTAAATPTLRAAS